MTARSDESPLDTDSMSTQLERRRRLTAAVVEWSGVTTRGKFRGMVSA
ncbi:hypothetical protein QM716_03705 [Rhodococcus sp. IEGM 1409]|nr:hypothetical protein [Rhodococcus sp. IEGM 1409]MDI9898954.1 hypothetical protein [Rhodococcus sp. IEGM 1409]